MWIIQYDNNFTGNAQSCFWAQVMSSALCSATLQTPSITQSTQRSSRTGFLRLKIWHIWLWLWFFTSYWLLTWAFLQGRIPGVVFSSSLLPCVRWPSKKKNLRHVLGYLSRKASSESVFGLYSVSETTMTLASLLRRSCWSQCRHLAAHPAFLCPSHFPAWAPLPDSVWQCFLSPFGKSAHL